MQESCASNNGRSRVFGDLTPQSGQSREAGSSHAEHYMYDSDEENHPGQQGAALRIEKKTLQPEAMAASQDAEGKPNPHKEPVINRFGLTTFIAVQRRNAA